MKRIALISFTIIALGAAAIFYIFYGLDNGGPALVNNPINSTSTNSTSTSTSTTTSTPPIASNPNPPATTTPPATTSTPPTSNPGPTPKEIVYANRAKRQVVFTFDGGGVSDVSAPKILAVLAKHNVQGTFFLTGDWAQKFPATTGAIDASGHEIFNHTQNHPDLTKLSDAQIRTELREANRIISNITGETTKPYFRPPFGARNSHVYDIAWQEGYRGVYWSTDAWDWREGWTNEMVKQRIYDGLTPGAIYLMHIGDTITGDILDEVFTKIRSQGYTIVSLTQGLK